MNTGIIGAGRIGRVHIRNITSSVPQINITALADPMLNEEITAFARQHHIPKVTTDAREIFDDPDIDAVIICSSTNTHAEYIIEAAKAGKHIFCEKPVDYDLARVREAIDAAENAGVILQIGFCRRFDHNHRAVYDMVRSGSVGDVNLIRISSRDPEPPSIDYVKVSGGIFYDMMIHDFDMARFLAGCEVTEVQAWGSVLVDPAIGEAGDVDTAAVMLRFENGAIGMIDNSRQAVYGYDQRVEVFGSRGMAFNDNDVLHTARILTADSTCSAPMHRVMFDRYTQAFISEMQSFARALETGTGPEVNGEDGLPPVLMAAAATLSMKEHRPVKISEIIETANVNPVHTA
ncbi:MAG: inositol 2-dehydrogenase [Firmicutes bacterium]|nr:inositol 2-dehydrogenase [Bacillota bacterium]